MFQRFFFANIGGSFARSKPTCMEKGNPSAAIVFLEKSDLIEVIES